MQTLTPQQIWDLSETELQAFLDSGALKPTSDTIRFYAPSFTYYHTKHFCSNNTAFPTISITGNTCALGCKHCGGIVLKTMHPATTPKQLLSLATKLKENGACGILISGGCTSTGAVPLDRFTSAIATIKQTLGLTVFVHTGITTKKTAEALKAAGVDAALIDVLGSQQVIRKILNLNVTVQDYADSLLALGNAGLTTVPHVIVGLNSGKLEGELNALQTISRSHPKALVIIAFMPIPKTQMAKITPPKPIDIAKVTALARQMFPSTPLALGCMRPKGSSRSQTDVLALKSGADAVAFPTQTAIEYAQAHGYKTAFSPFCCAQMALDFV